MCRLSTRSKRGSHWIGRFERSALNRCVQNENRRRSISTDSSPCSWRTRSSTACPETPANRKAPQFADPQQILGRDRDPIDLLALLELEDEPSGRQARHAVSGLVPDPELEEPLPLPPDVDLERRGREFPVRWAQQDVPAALPLWTAVADDPGHLGHVTAGAALAFRPQSGLSEVPCQGQDRTDAQIVAGTAERGGAPWLERRVTEALMILRVAAERPGDAGAAVEVAGRAVDSVDRVLAADLWRPTEPIEHRLRCVAAVAALGVAQVLQCLLVDLVRERGRVPAALPLLVDLAVATRAVFGTRGRRGARAVVPARVDRSGFHVAVAREVSVRDRGRPRPKPARSAPRGPTESFFAGSSAPTVPRRPPGGKTPFQSLKSGARAGRNPRRRHRVESRRKHRRSPPRPHR